MPVLLAIARTVLKEQLIKLGLRVAKVVILVMIAVFVLLMSSSCVPTMVLLALTSLGSAGSTVSPGPGGSLIITIPSGPTSSPVASGSPLSVAIQAALRAPCAIPAGLVLAVGSIEDGSFGSKHAIGPSIFIGPTGQTIHAYGPAQFLSQTWQSYGDGIDPPTTFSNKVEIAPAPDAHIWLTQYAYPALARYLCALHVDTDPVAALWAYSGCVPGPGCARTDNYALDALARARVYQQQIDAMTPAGSGPLADQLIANAESWLGVKYVFGGCSSSGVDCSCFVQIVSRPIGIGLPRTAQQQWDAMPHISTPVRGDYAFFRQTYIDPSVIVTHVGIVTRVEPNGVVWMIDAPGARAANDPPDFPDGRVREDAISGFWAQHIFGYGRALPVVPLPNAA